MAVQAAPRNSKTVSPIQNVRGSEKSSSARSCTGHDTVRNNRRPEISAIGSALGISAFPKRARGTSSRRIRTKRRRGVHGRFTRLVSRSGERIKKKKKPRTIVAFIVLHVSRCYEPFLRAIRTHCVTPQLDCRVRWCSFGRAPRETSGRRRRRKPVSHRKEINRRRTIERGVVPKRARARS